MWLNFRPFPSIRLNFLSQISEAQVFKHPNSVVDNCSSAVSFLFQIWIGAEDPRYGDPALEIKICHGEGCLANQNARCSSMWTIRMRDFLVWPIRTQDFYCVTNQTTRFSCVTNQNARFSCVTNQNARFSCVTNQNARFSCVTNQNSRFFLCDQSEREIFLCDQSGQEMFLGDCQANQNTSFHRGKNQSNQNTTFFWSLKGYFNLFVWFHV